jgi:chromosome segregation ATPase
VRIVSAAKYAALEARCNRIARELEDAKKRDAERLATITRLRAERDRRRDERPDSPVQQPEPVTGDAELRRQLNLARRTIREQADQIEQLQASHIADTRELHDLRQGAAS